MRRDVAAIVQDSREVIVRPFRLCVIEKLDDKIYFEPQITSVLATSTEAPCTDYVEVRAAGFWKCGLDEDADRLLTVRWNFPPAEDIAEEPVNRERLSQYRLLDFGGETFLITDEVLAQWRDYLPSSAFFFRKVKSSKLATG